MYARTREGLAGSWEWIKIVADICIKTRKKPLLIGAASSGTHVEGLLVSYLFITRLPQQGSDEVAETLVCKDEFEDTQCPFKDWFHSGITFKMFGGEGTQRRKSRCRYVRLCANVCGFCVVTAEAGRIPGRHRSKDIALSTLGALSLRCY